MEPSPTGCQGEGFGDYFAASFFDADRNLENGRNRKALTRIFRRRKIGLL